MNDVSRAFIATALGIAAHLGTSSLLAAQTPASPAAAATVDYKTDVQPLLAEKCYGCHGPDVQQSGLRLDLRQNALRGGDYGPVIIPGKSAESKLVRRVVDGDGSLQMPPTGPLTTEEVRILQAWIDQGAEFRTDVAEQEPVRAAIDPTLATFISAVRSAPRSAIEALIADHRELITAPDAAGSTLLHHAAGFASVETLTALLDAGADVNAKNRLGSTPLHWAIDDEMKVRLLLKRGADLKAKQVEGRTPLYQAAVLGHGEAIVRLLLENGADPNAATANGRTALMAAAARGDVPVLRLLVAAKANVNAKDSAGDTPLMLAASDSSPDAVRFLLEQGADPRARTKRNETALGNAGTAGVEATVRLLLDHGAEVNVRNMRGYSPLMLAAGSDAIPAGAVKLLLAAGADTSFTADYDETARDLAAKRGDTHVTRLLGGSLPKPAHAGADALQGGRPARAISDAVEQALVPVETQSHKFIRTAGCNSCHSQDLASAAAALARSRGLNAPRQIEQLPPPPMERLMDFSIVAVSGTIWELFDLGMNNAPKNAYTDAAARVIKATQTPEGNWSVNQGRRPPMNAGDYQATALAIYAIKRYTPIGGEVTSEQAIASALRWLERAKPESTQDRAFHLLALAWAQPGSARVSRAVRALAGMQRSDGGWSQLPATGSDAYATGQVLYALNQAGKMSMADSGYRKGVDYLLRTQAPDGTWRVSSRSIWLQPYFESGFPYGQDQFISTAGTAWAAMALATAVTPPTVTRR
jgi:ankyrin repeat protein